jgi:pentapeptide repeat protein
MLGVVVGGLLVLVLYVFPSALVGPDSNLTTAERLKAENDVRTTLIQAVGGAILFAGLYFTGRSYILNREGQVTERFTRAIDQLGNRESLDVRLGGIYALERIAQESKRDHWPIMEVLTAFIREGAPRIPTQSGEVKLSGFTQDRTRPVADVQAALTVLGRRKRQHEAEGQRLALQRTDLKGADLKSAHLEDASFVGAHMESANLGGAHMEGAILRGAHLERAYLGGAHLERAYLGGAHLERAQLTEAHMESANLGGAHLEGANLRDAHLEHASLAGASMEGANLSGAHLEGASLEDASRLTGEQIDMALVDSSTKLPAIE